MNTREAQRAGRREQGLARINAPLVEGDWMQRTRGMKLEEIKAEASSSQEEFVWERTRLMRNAQASLSRGAGLAGGGRLMAQAPPRPSIQPSAVLLTSAGPGRRLVRGRGDTAGRGGRAPLGGGRAR